MKLLKAIFFLFELKLEVSKFVLRSIMPKFDSNKKTNLNLGTLASRILYLLACSIQSV